MAKFFRYQDKYFNLDHVAKVEILRGGTNYINIVSSNEAKSLIVQIQERDSTKAEAIFDKLGQALQAEDLSDYIR